MPIPVLFPKVSLETATGRIAQWLVRDGDAVRRGQVLFEVESDKASVEVDAPADGIIRALTSPETDVAAGAEVAQIVAPADLSAFAPPPGPDTGAVREPAALAPQPPAAMAKPDNGPLPTPLARRLACDHGISLAGLSGTGPRGRVQRKNVLALLAHRQSPAAGALLAPVVSAPMPLTTDAGALHHAWLRRGDGVPLVLLHGFAGDLNGWRGLFAGRSHPGPVLALDLPAHGLSPRAVPDDIEALTDRVEHSIAGLVHGPAVLVGHSFGGAVAARIAARGTLDLCGLCLIAPAGLGPEINAAFVEGILRAQEPASLRPWLRDLVHDSAALSDAYVHATALQRRDPTLTAAMRAFAARFLPDGTQTLSIVRDLARLDLPVRVVFGRNDRILPFARTGCLPGNVGLHAVDLCGHMPHLEHPALVLRILSELRGAG